MGAFVLVAKNIHTIYIFGWLSIKVKPGSYMRKETEQLNYLNPTAAPRFHINKAKTPRTPRYAERLSVYSSHRSFILYNFMGKVTSFTVNDKPQNKPQRNCFERTFNLTQTADAE